MRAGSRVSSELIHAPETAEARVLLIGPLPPPYGGTEAITDMLYRGSYEDSFSFRFFNSSKPLRNDERGHLRPKNVWVNLRSLAAFIGALRDARPQVVWIPLAQNLMGFLRDSAYILLARAAGARVVLHFHGATFDRFYDRRGSLLRAYVRFVLRLTTAVVIPGDRLHSQFDRVAPSLPRFTLYNALATSRFTELDRERRNEPSEIEVVYLGHVSEAKGALDLIRAAALLRPERPALRIKLIGELIEHDTNTDFLPNGRSSRVGARALAEDLGVSEMVQFQGPVPMDKVPGHLQSADIFVSPSYSEGFSIAMLEAMAAGLPMVVTNVGAAPEVLASDINCIFVNPGAPAELAAGIARLARDETLRRRMGAANRELVASRFLEDRLQEGFRRLASSALSDWIEPDRTAQLGRIL
jgi:glycosyltransferase involved in cell wall biosynthesis